MNLKIGIVGLPNVGKSTLFNALTNAGALAANYPFATIEPNVGIVPVPDERLEVLAKMYETEKVVPATVEFVDIAGLVAGASQGEGLGNKFLAHIRECQIICHVVRVFRDDDVTHVAQTVDPKRDIEVIQTELELADLETREKAEAKRKKQPAGAADPGMVIPYLTEKPVIYLFNVDEQELLDTELKQRMSELVAPSQAVFVDAKLEAEMAGMTAVQGATAPEAAGVIHTDFQRGFIAAEVMKYDDLVALGSEQAVKAAGKLRTEGKTYVMQEGDVVEFRFNVSK